MRGGQLQPQLGIWKRIVGGLDCDVGVLSFSDYGNMSTLTAFNYWASTNDGSGFPNKLFEEASLHLSGVSPVKQSFILYTTLTFLFLLLFQYLHSLQLISSRYFINI